MGLREDLQRSMGAGSGMGNPAFQAPTPVQGQPVLGGVDTGPGSSLSDEDQKARDAANPQPSFRDQVKKLAYQGAKDTASNPLSFFSAPSRFAFQFGKKSRELEDKGAGIVAGKLGLHDQEAAKPGKESNAGKVADADFAADAGKGEDQIQKAYGGLNIAGGGGVIPAHEGQTTSKRIEDQYHGAGATETAAVLDTEAANIHAIKTQQENAEHQAAVYSHLVDQQQAQEQKRAGILSQDIADREKMMSDIRSEKIDPNRIFEGPGGGFRKIAGVLAVALGGYAQGLRGGPNTALEIINKSIDDDVASQRANLETKKGLLDSKSSLFAQKMQMYGDERAAALATKQDVLAGAIATAEAAMGDAKTDQEKARAGTVLGGLQKQHADLERQLHPWVTAQVTGLDYRKVYADKFAEARAKGADEKQSDQFATEYTSRLQGKPIQTGGAALGGAGGKGKKGLPAGVIGQIGAVDSAIQALDDEIALTKDTKIGLADKRARSKKNLDILSLEIPHAFTGGVPTPEQSKETRENLPTEQGTLSFQNISPIGAPDRLRQLQSQKQALLHKKEALRATANEERKVGSTDAVPEE